MKKLIATLLLTTLLATNANAGILILTGNMGQNLKNPTLAGILILVFLGGTGVGLVIDEDSAMNNDFNYELSEASLNILAEKTALIKANAELAGKEHVITTISIETAEAIAEHEGYTGVERIKLISALTTL